LIDSIEASKPRLVLELGSGSGSLCTAAATRWQDAKLVTADVDRHAPQGVREQNYIRRPLDLLRLHHERIEAWMLEQAGVTFDAAAPAGLRVVA